MMMRFIALWILHQITVQENRRRHTTTLAFRYLSAVSIPTTYPGCFRQEHLEAVAGLFVQA